MGAGSSSRKRAAAAPEPEPEPEPEQELPPLRGAPEQTGVLSAAALAVAATSAAWEDGSSPASFSSSAKSAGARHSSKAIGQYARRREPTSAVEVRMRGRRFGREDVASDVIAAAVTIQSAFRTHRVRQQVRDFRQVAEAYSTKIGTSRGGDRRTRRARDRVPEKHSWRGSPVKAVSPAGIGGTRSALQPLHPVPTNTANAPTLAVEIPEDLRSARVREWVATGGEISPGGDITMTNRSAVADAFLSGSQAKPAKLSAAPVKAIAAESRDEEGLDYHATSVDRQEGSQVGSILDNHEVGDSVSSYNGGVSSSFRRRASRPGPPSVTTQSSWDDGAFANIPSPSDVRKRARARKGPRRKRHPPRQRGSESATSRSDASAWQPAWQGPPAGWPAPGWGYVPPPSASYGLPATAPGGVAQSGGQTTIGWADAFYQGGRPPMAAGFPPAGTIWSQQPPPSQPQPQQQQPHQQPHHQQQQQQQQQQHHHHHHHQQQQQQQQQEHQQRHQHRRRPPPPPPPQQQLYGNPDGPANWWGAPHDAQQFRADVAAYATAGTRHAQMPAQQTSTAASDDMLGRIDRIEGAMEALLQRLAVHQLPLEEKLPPLAGDQNRQQN